METKINAKSSSILFLAILFVCISLSPLFRYPLDQADFLCMLLFYLNGFIAVFHICRETKRHAFSIELMIWLFMYFFMFLAPVIQYLTSSFPWHGNFSSDELILVNVIILLFSTFFDLGKFLSNRVVIGERRKQHHFISDPFILGPKIQFVFCIAMIFMAIYSFSKTGLLGIVVSRADATHAFYSGNNSSVSMLVNAFVPAFMAYITADVAQSCRNKRTSIALSIVCFICLLVCFFPTSIPRYKMATIYGTIFVILFPRLCKKTRFTWLFVIAMFFVFPIFSNIRHNLSNANVSRILSDLLNSFSGADYDAYRMLAGTVMYISTEGISWGRQLLGAILFFIPRSLWPDKPVGSGALIIRSELGASAFSNVSCPYIAEALLNFGIFGLLLFSFILGVLAGKCDYDFWEKHTSETKFSPYLLLVFMIFFIMRGDFLSSFSYTMGFAVTGLLLKIFTVSPQEGIVGKNGTIN